MELITLFILSVISALIFFFIIKYTYWKRRNVVSPQVTPILGNYKNFFLNKKTVGVTVQSIYQQFPKEPFVGAYFGTEPVLIPRDPEMIKIIMTKDFYNFSGRLLVDHEYRNPFITSSLFLSSGDNWKTLRQNLNPMFTSGKLKGLFSLISEKGQKLDDYLELQYKQSEVQDFKDVATRYVLEVVGTCLFGLNFEAMVQGESHIKKVADKMEDLKDITFYKSNLRDVCPNVYHLFWKNFPGTDGMDNIFFDLANQSFESRNNTPIGRKDFVDFLIKFKKQGFIQGEGVRNSNNEVKSVQIEVSETMLAAQVLGFFVAGFSTSSISLSLTLYELAKNPHIQQRLADDIEKVLMKYNGEITYEAIHDMKYLDMVISEIGRKYPQLGIITRECTSDYMFSDYRLKIEKGMRIHIPVWAIHHDPKYYPEPEKFDPERFTPEEVQKRPTYTYLAFGEGQRICIGMRFAKMQVAIGLIRILRKYRMEPCETTVSELKFDPRAFGILSRDPVNLRMVLRTKE